MKYTFCIDVPNNDQDERNLNVWYKVRSTDKDGDKVVGILHDRAPDLTGFVQTRAAQVEEGTDLNLGGIVLLCYYKQAALESVGCGTAWILVKYG